MSPDASNIIASVTRSLEPDRSPSASSRASEVAQELLAGEVEHLSHQTRTAATDAIAKNKIRQEHEYKRRQFERHNNPSSEQEDEGNDGPLIDVVV